jgi:hypothetical protein
MWLFTLNSFVSVVRHRDEPDKLLVRARRQEDLVELLGKRSMSIFEDACADYRFRVIMPEKDFQEIISEYISQKLTYDNFKAAQKPDPEFSNFLHNVWAEGYKMQDGTFNDLPWPRKD